MKIKIVIIIIIIIIMGKKVGKFTYFKCMEHILEHILSICTTSRPETEKEAFWGMLDDVTTVAESEVLLYLLLAT